MVAAGWMGGAKDGGVTAAGTAAAAGCGTGSGAAGAGAALLLAARLLAGAGAMLALDDGLLGRASSNSCTDWKRSSGFWRIAFITACSVWRETFELTWRTSGSRATPETISGASGGHTPVSR